MEEDIENNDLLKNKIAIFPSTEYPQKCAWLIAKQLSSTIHQNGRATLALSGGSTPIAIYQKLVQREKDSLDWQKVTFLLADERLVENGHPESLKNLALNNLFLPLQIKAENQLLVDLNLPLIEAAKDYNDKLEGHLSIQNGSMAKLSLVLLGVGEDGHFASVFPGEQRLLAVPTKRRGASDLIWLVDDLNLISTYKAPRLTLTPKVILNSEKVFVLINGERKKEVVQRLFTTRNTITEEDMLNFPALALKGKENVYWYLDEDAARNIQTGSLI
ncbi:MAG TPA: 6-phosphogluconolactonase [Oligoflexia bacterium]|nr:6-phosphogluconolactonase [Oligoflexia bacterium]HMP27673.1 6-phosphogluconolactonase [Oligoflexia bacterium]